MKRTGFKKRTPKPDNVIEVPNPKHYRLTNEGIEAPPPIVEPEAALRQRAQFPLHVDAITWDRRGKRITLIARGRKVVMLLALMPETPDDRVKPE